MYKTEKICTISVGFFDFSKLVQQEFGKKLKQKSQCTVVGKGEINYFSILDFMASEQSLEDIWKLGGQNFEK